MTMGQLMLYGGAALLVLTLVLALIFSLRKPKDRPASAAIPDSVTSIGWSAFEACNGLTDAYYGGSEEQWKQIAIGSSNDPLLNATIHYNSAG